MPKRSAGLVGLVAVLAVLLSGQPVVPNVEASAVPSPTDAHFGAAPGPTTFIGAKVNSAVHLTTTASALAYDTLVFEVGGTFRDPTYPERLCAPFDGYYSAFLGITTLGTGYGKKNNNDVHLNIRIYGLTPQEGDIAYARWHAPGGSAELVQAASPPVYLDAGQCVESYVYPTGLFVEANWAPLSNLSPVFALTYLGS